MYLVMLFTPIYNSIVLILTFVRCITNHPLFSKNKDKSVHKHLLNKKLTKHSMTLLATICTCSNNNNSNLTIATRSINNSNSSSIYYNNNLISRLSMNNISLATIREQYLLLNIHLPHSRNNCGNIHSNKRCIAIIYLTSGLRNSI